jgi:transposase
LTTKIDALVDALGNLVAFSLTAGQASDLSQAEPLLEGFVPEAFLADKAYDADRLIIALRGRGIKPVIPPKVNRLIQRYCDFALYRERNLVERFFNTLKHFRGLATRYDKLARNFLSAVHLVETVILLK